MVIGLAGKKKEGDSKSINEQSKCGKFPRKLHALRVIYGDSYQNRVIVYQSARGMMIIDSAHAEIDRGNETPAEVVFKVAFGFKNLAESVLQVDFRWKKNRLYFSEDPFDRVWLLVKRGSALIATGADEKKESSHLEAVAICCAMIYQGDPLREAAATCTQAISNGIVVHFLK